MAYRRKELIDAADVGDDGAPPVAVSKRRPAKKKVSEETVKRRIKVLFDSFGVTWFMPVQGQFARKGVSDFIVCLKGGKYLCVEAKSSHGSASALQLQWIEKVRAVGGLGMVVGPDEIPALKAVLQANAEGSRPRITGL